MEEKKSAEIDRIKKKVSIKEIVEADLTLPNVDEINMIFIQLQLISCEPTKFKMQQIQYKFQKL